MRQVVILEEGEVARLLRGKQLEINTGNGLLTISFDESVRTRKLPKAEDQGSNDFACKKCGRSFASPWGLRVHKAKKGH